MEKNIQHIYKQKCNRIIIIVLYRYSHIPEKVFIPKDVNLRDQHMSIETIDIITKNITKWIKEELINCTSTLQMNITCYQTKQHNKIMRHFSWSGRVVHSFYLTATRQLLLFKIY